MPYPDPWPTPSPVRRARRTRTAASCRAVRPTTDRPGSLRRPRHPVPRPTGRPWPAVGAGSPGLLDGIDRRTHSRVLRFEQLAQRHGGLRTIRQPDEQLFDEIRVADHDPTQVLPQVPDAESLQYLNGPGVPIGIAFVKLRSEEHTSELQSRRDLVCRLL